MTQIKLDPRKPFNRHGITWNCIDYRHPEINEFVVYNNTVAKVTIPYPHDCVIVEPSASVVACPKGQPCKVRDHVMSDWFDAILYYAETARNIEYPYFASVIESDNEDNDDDDDDEVDGPEWYKYCELQPATNILDTVPALLTMTPATSSVDLSNAYVPVSNNISFPYIECRYKAHAANPWYHGYLIGVTEFDDDGNPNVDPYIVSEYPYIAKDADGAWCISSFRYCEVLPSQPKNI